MNHPSVFLFLAFGFQLLTLRTQAAPAPLPDYELHPALEMSLWASEPEVVDPVALTWDETGRMYVVEMRDYPYGFGPNHQPGGTIRLLEDTDGDGKCDRSVLFAEGLSFPTSIVPWNGGVLVTAPPEILFLKDTDGDGKADLREVVLTGFTLGVTDSNVNGLRWALDNRVHGVNGGNGGSVRSPRRSAEPVPLRNLDFSFDPGTGDFTPTYHTSGGFGLVFDEWGRSFVTYNINHIQERMIPVRYLNRFPGLPPLVAVESISDHGEMARIYPVSEPETRVNHPEQAGHFSAAGGLGWIGSPAYPGDLYGSILVCDVVGNLVHRDLLSSHGPGHLATRAPAEQKSEFFASRDRAFRPVGLELGPDGALYLIDMQREVIEHPDYIPEKVREKLNLRAGDDRGRIYRITPKGGLPNLRPNLRGASVAELVRYLADPNPWWRGTAQRLLVERRDKTAIADLKELAGFPSNPLGRLHALWTLAGLDALDEPMVLRALSASEPGLRENALRLAEQFLPGSKPLQAALSRLATDPAPGVRFQTALALGQLEHQEFAALLKVLLQDYSWRWSRLAVLSSIRGDEAKFLQALLSHPRFRGNAPSKLDLVRELSDLAGGRAVPAQATNVAAVLTLLSKERLAPEWSLAALEGLHSGLLRAGPRLPANEGVARALDELSRDSAPSRLAATWKIARAFGLPANSTQQTALRAAKARVIDRTRSLASRLEDAELLGLGSFAEISPALLSLLDGPEPAGLQRAALEGLAQFHEPGVAQGILDRWRSLGPAIRPPALNLLLQRPLFHGVLLAAIESGKITVGELSLDLEQRRRLLRQSTPEIQARAARWIADEEYSNRKAAVETWLKKLPATGDPIRGRAIFEKTCAPCHAFAGMGHQVGPDLEAMAHRSVEDLVSNILDPNMAIQPGYVSYSVETLDGDVQNGILSSESAYAVTLLQPLGIKRIFPRSQIKRLESSGFSLMPEGLESALTPADLRDLVEFLKNKR